MTLWDLSEENRRQEPQLGTTPLLKGHLPCSIIEKKHQAHRYQRNCDVHLQSFP